VELPLREVVWSTKTQHHFDNCLDRHVTSERKDKPAIIWRGEQGEEQRLTYDALYREVMRFANGLLRLGVRKGDRGLYLHAARPLSRSSRCSACARSGPSTRLSLRGSGLTRLQCGKNITMPLRQRSSSPLTSVTDGKGYPAQGDRKGGRSTQTTLRRGKVIVLRRGTPARPISDPAMEVGLRRSLVARLTLTARQRRWMRRIPSSSSTPAARPARRKASSTPAVGYAVGT